MIKRYLRACLPIFLLVWGGKLLWLLAFGVIVDPDSLGYLQPELNLYHPPGYNAFLWLSLKVLPFAAGPLLLQSALFSFSFACAAKELVSNPRWLRIAAFLMAIDPCTGYLCASVMSEPLYLTFCMLFVIFGLRMLRDGGWRPAAWAGLWAAAAFMVRYSAPVLVLALLFALLLSRLAWRQGIWIGAVALCSFFLATLPLRLLYQAKYDTFQVNAYSGLSLWNNAAILYPGSSAQSDPQSEFEHFLKTLPDTMFQPSLTWNTAHIFGNTNTAGAYVDQNARSTADVMQLSSEIGATARRIILERPFRYLTQVVLPNIGHTFQGFETKGTLLIRDLPPPYDDLRLRDRRQSPWWWNTWFALAVFLTLTVVLSKKGDSEIWFMLALIWGYYFSAALMTALFPRHFFVLTPFIALGLSYWVQNGKNPPPARETSPAGTHVHG